MYTYIVGGKVAASTWIPTGSSIHQHKKQTKLASVARRVLAQNVSASAAERNWSVYGQIMTPSRSRMSHVRGDKLVYCHDARGAALLHMKLKLQGAGYKQATEKWVSDSDSDESDESDEEDLKM